MARRAGPAVQEAQSSWFNAGASLSVASPSRPARGILSFVSPGSLESLFNIRQGLARAENTAQHDAHDAAPSVKDSLPAGSAVMPPAGTQGPAGPVGGNRELVEALGGPRWLDVWLVCTALPLPDARRTNHLGVTPGCSCQQACCTRNLHPPGRGGDLCRRLTGPSQRARRQRRPAVCRCWSSS